MRQLDQPCSQHFTYRQLIECGETWQTSSIDNRPLEENSWQALADLAGNILDPVYDHFGGLQLTYGFSSPKLATARKKLAKERSILPAIYPKLDQHASFEKNKNGDIICPRGGAACDFYIKGTASQNLVIWIVSQLPFDRLYYYGQDRPIHISYNKEQRSGEVSVMSAKTNGQGLIPRRFSSERFLEQFQL